MNSKGCGQMERRVGVVERCLNDSAEEWGIDQLFFLRTGSVRSKIISLIYRAARAVGLRPGAQGVQVVRKRPDKRRFLEGADAFF